MWQSITEKVADIIQCIKYLIHTLVPEVFWKEYGANKKVDWNIPFLFALAVSVHFTWSSSLLVAQ